MLNRLAALLIAGSLGLGCAAPLPDADHDSLEATAISLHFVVHAGEPLLVLEAQPTGDELVGDIELLGADPESWAVAALRPLTEPHPALGTVHALYGPSGAVCAASVIEVGILRRAYAEPAVNLGSEPELSKRAEDIWDLAAGSELLVGRLVSDEDCVDARWSVPAQLAEPQIFSIDATESDRDRDDATAQLRATPEYADLQADYAAEQVDGPPSPRGGWEHDELGSIESRRFLDPAGGRELIVVAFSSGGGCGGFRGDLWGLFERRASGLDTVLVSTDAGLPDQIFDFDRDGRLELMTGERALLPSAEGWDSVDLSVPDYGCSC